MPWQDIVITLGGLVFIIALIPSIFSNDKPALATSFLNATVLLIFVVVYMSLGLLMSGITMGILTVLWFVLAIQKYHSNKNKLSNNLTTP